MSLPHFSGSEAARVYEESTSHTYETLEAAALEAGQHPERAVGLAQDLQIGLQQPCDLIKPVLAGALIRPGCVYSDFEPEMLPGAVESGLARAGAQLHLDDEEYTQLHGQIRGSMLFARHVSDLLYALRHPEVGETEPAAGLYEEIVYFGSHLFRGGFLAGVDAAEAGPLSKREPALQKSATQVGGAQ